MNGRPVTVARMFRKILIANRGEIARRINTVAQSMGIKTVAVYSDADEKLPFVKEANEAVRLGPAPARDSYLNVDAILEAVKKTGAEAVHPGYGFISENAQFARTISNAGVVFVGPPPEAMERMKDKSEARRLVVEAGVPVVPGTATVVPDVATAAKEAEAIGYPVVLKTDEPSIAHKSDAGGVRLGIGSPAELAAAYDDVAGRLGPAVSVATMVEVGVELALGVVNDVQLGPLVLVAAGGVLVEVLHDRALAVPPLDAARASALVDGLRVRALLAGVRGQPAADLGSVTDAIVALSVLACELGDAVAAIDVNPLVCGPAGAVAVDALVVQRTHR